MTTPTQVQDELPPPVAWLRKWQFDGEEQKKVLGRWPTKFKLLPVTVGQCLRDDVPLYTADQFRTALASSRAADEALMRDVLETIERSCDPCLLPANGHNELKLTARALRARLEGTKT